MPRDFEVYLQDMLEAIEKIKLYLAGMSREEFERDSKTIDAVLRNLEVIGEASKGVPEAIRNLNPRIEWRQIAGLRDVLIHHYFGVNLDIVWDILENELDELEQNLRSMLSK